MNAPPWFWPLLLILCGMFMASIGAGFHFWPEVAVGTVFWLAGVVWALVRIVEATR